MSADDFDSLDIHETADGESRADEPASLGDQATVGNEGASTAGDEGEDSDSTEELDSVVPLVDLGKHFEIVEVLGRGGMGEVFKARDRALGRLVAIKRIRGRDGSVVRSRGALERFKREARSVAALEHSNIVRLWSFCRDADGPYLVMEFVDGPTLAEQLKQGPLNLDLAIDWTCRLCDALEVAHAKGIFHRDVKPLNVLLAGGTTPKLSDFGLARRRSEDLLLSGERVAVGTLAYMPPEQERDASSVDARSDVYSLGATLYEMVTGSSPRRLRLSLVPDALRDVLTKALEEDPADRFQTAAEFRVALREVTRSTRAAVAHLPGAGVCPACQASNPVTNRFCRECATSLETTCLACEAEMPLWENVCQACGRIQVDLLETHRGQLRDWMHEALRLREQSRFDEALHVASRVSAFTHPRLAADTVWAVEFQAEVKQQRVEWTETFDRGMNAARRLVNEHDEAGALRLLDTLPTAVRAHDSRRRTEFETLREHARACVEELPGLMRQIRASVGDKSYDGLLPQVERYLALRPGEERVTKLHSQLLARVKRKRRKRIDSARAAFEAGRIKRGLATLETFPAEERDNEIAELISWAETRENRCPQCSDEPGWDGRQCMYCDYVIGDPVRQQTTPQADMPSSMPEDNHAREFLVDDILSAKRHERPAAATGIPASRSSFNSSRRRELIRQARKCMAEDNRTEALNSLHQIPEMWRDEHINALLTDPRVTTVEAEMLLREAEWKARSDDEVIDGEITQTGDVLWEGDALVETPGFPRQLVEQLMDDARDQAAKQDYAGAIETLNLIPDRLQNGEVLELITEFETDCEQSRTSWHVWALLLMIAMVWMLVPLFELLFD